MALPMRRAAAAGALAALCWSTAAAAAPVRFVAMGDMPYDWPQDGPRMAKLIAAANATMPDFLVHVGDIKSGVTRCTQESYARVLKLFAQSQAPLVYTPGDNEWTDCRRTTDGGYDPVEGLEVVRSMFFTSAESLGRRPMPMAVQASEPGFATYVENRRWQIGKVLFFTVHVVGSNNNLRLNSAAARKEYGDRMRADYAWLKESFAAAKRSGAGAVVLFFHGDPLFELPFPFRTGFNDWIAALEHEALGYPGPILIVHGDLHRLTLDHPIRALATGKVLANLVRLEVPGYPDVEAVRVTVDPDVPQPFAFTLLNRGKALAAPPVR
jgi:Calcineurin-like phosphoesterase